MEVAMNSMEGSSSSGVSAIDPSEDRRLQDSKHLLEIFPQEIWEQILNQVRDPGTLSNLSNASPFFRHLLISKRVLFLFPQVRQILEAHNKTLKQDHLPWNSHMLSFRLVCKSWCQSVDAFYQNLPEHYKMEQDFGNNFTVFSQAQVTFDEQKSPWKFNKFLDHFSKSHSEATDRSPFIGRAVSFKYLQMEPQGHTAGGELRVGDRLFLEVVFHREPPQGIADLLLKYGEHLWFCEMEVEDKFSMKVNSYRKLKELLELMPNLKVLHLKYTSSKEPDNLARGYVYTREGGRYSALQDQDPPDDPAKLEAEAEDNPLLVLGDLQILKTTNVPPHISNALVREKCHLTGLEIKREKIHENYQIFSASLQNLKQLAVQFFTEEEFKALESSEVKWPLEKLQVEFIQCSQIERSRIFTGIQDTWANTLVQLVIALPQVENEGQEKQILTEMEAFKLNMPVLQRIQLKMQSEFYSLEF